MQTISTPKKITHPKIVLPKDSISACLIVRDEEAVIEDCLASIESWVDEIILVDTGSTDKTLEIAGKFDKVKIFHQPWQNDFSFHRNYSIEQATKSWIFIIDADERVIPGDGENVKKVMVGLENDIFIIAVDIFNLYGQPRVIRSHAKGLRFFWRANNPKYIGRIHNRPIVEGGAKLYKLPFRINHFGYDMPKEIMAKKYERTITLCREWTKDEPENPEAWMQLARVMKVKDGQPNFEEFPEVIKIIESGLAQTNGDFDLCHIRAQLLNLMAWVKHALKEDEEAISYGKMALALYPEYLDAVLIIGLAYAFGKNTALGEIWLKRYLMEQEAYQYSDRVNGIAMENINERKLVYQVLIDIETFKEYKNVNNVQTGADIQRK